MGIMAVCGALLLAGVAAGVAWGGRTFDAPPADGGLSPAEVARRFAWYCSVLLMAGISAGIAVIGGGGRLAMRLLAVTGGDAAQGRITEADEVVGTITVGGTIGFVIFNGIFGGLVAGGLYLVVRRFLPPGRLGGMLFGVALLVILGTTIDPLRKDNPDFDIVGPGWLAVVVFTIMAVAFGLALAGIAARLSSWLPLPSTDRRVLLRYVPAVALAAIGFSITAALVILGVAVLLATRWDPLIAAVRSDRWVLGGRIVSAAIVLVALPNAISNVADIAGR